MAPAIVAGTDVKGTLDPRRTSSVVRLLELAPEAVIVTDPAGRCTWVNPRWADLAGLSTDGAIGSGWTAAIHPADRPSFVAAWHVAVLNRQPFEREVRLRRPDGAVRQVLVRASPVGEDGVGHVGVVTDVTACRRAEHERDRFFALSPDPVCVVGPDLRVHRGNRAFHRAYAWTEADLVGTPVGELIHPDDHAVASAWLTALRDGQDQVEIPLRLRRGDGAWRRTAVTVGAPATAGEELFVVVRDVTDRWQRESELRALAETDPVTGLANRAALLVALQATLDEGAPATVLFLDLDDFKVINDRFGHEAGDAVLRHVAEGVRSVVRREDLVARVGGDELVVLLRGAVPIEALGRIVGNLREAVASPTVVGPGAVVRVDASVGVAVAKAGEDVSALLRRADHAMYADKRSSGRGSR